jgi:Bacterial Ig-like domain (group 2)
VKTESRVHSIVALGLGVTSLLLLFFTGCGGSDTAGPNADALTIDAVSISAGADTLRSFGDTSQFTASASDKTGRSVSGVPITWSSSSAGIATVSPTGLVTAVSNGSTIIRAESGAASDEAVLVVAQAADSMALNPSRDTVRAIAITVTVDLMAWDSNGYVINNVGATWSSNDSSVAVPDAAGFVTTVGAGTATIRAIAPSGVSAAFDLTVDLSPISWICPGGDWWDVVSCWDARRLPTDEDSVVVATEGSFTVGLRGSVAVRSLVVGGPASSPTVQIGFAASDRLDLSETGRLYVAGGAVVVARAPIARGVVLIEGEFRHQSGTLSDQRIEVSAGGSFVMDNNCCLKSLERTTLVVRDGSIVHRTGGNTRLRDATIDVEVGGTIQLKGTNAFVWRLYSNDGESGEVNVRGRVEFFATADPVRYGRIKLGDVQLTFLEGSIVRVVEERTVTSGEQFEFVQIGLDPFGRGVPIQGQPLLGASTYTMQLNPVDSIGLLLIKN